MSDGEEIRNQMIALICVEGDALQEEAEDALETLDAGYMEKTQKRINEEIDFLLETLEEIRRRREAAKGGSGNPGHCEAVEPRDIRDSGAGDPGRPYKAR